MARCNTVYGAPRIDGVEDAVDRLVAAGAEDRGTQDLLRLGIDGDLHKAVGLALLDRPSDPGHRPLRREQLRPPARASASVMPTRPSGGSM